MTPDWQMGDRIRNRWEVYRILRGGMGIVYIVYDHHPDFREAFAAKTFQDEVFAQHPLVAERFTSEAVNWLKIDPHANVNHARLAEIIDGKPFLFSEYVSGGDLSRWIRTPRLTENLPQVLRFGIQFCDGMSHILSQGIKAHRDVKPQNCLVTEDGNLKITDFGLAKVFDEPSADRSAQETGGERSKDRDLASLMAGELHVGLTRTGVEKGTPAYMAPEQFEDAKHVDARADIYAFGIMLFQMVSGELPFRARTWKAFASLHRDQPPPLIRLKPLSLISIIDHCLAKDSKDRFQNFSALRNQLAETYQSLTGEYAALPAKATELDSIHLYNRGVGLGDLGRPQEALVYYDRALAVNPSFANAFYNKGVHLADFAQYESALACYDRAIEIKPRYDKAWANKGFALDSLGRTEEAMACYDKALEIDPSNGLALTNKGAALSALGLFDEAMTCFDRALELDPQDGRALNNKGDVLYELGQPQQALVCFNRALEINPRYQKGWYNKATLLLETGRRKEALACFDRALELNPQDSDSWMNKGNLLCDLGHADEGLTCYDRALEISPGDAQGWINKGATLADAGRISEALKSFREAERLGHPRAAELIAFCQADPGSRFALAAQLAFRNYLSNKGEISMRALGLVGGLLIAIFLGFYSGIWLAVCLVLAVLVFEVMLSFGRSQASHAVINSPARGAMADIIRNGVFLIPLGFSIAIGTWLGVAGVIAAYVFSMIAASHSPRRPN